MALREQARKEREELVSRLLKDKERYVAMNRLQDLNAEDPTDAGALNVVLTYTVWRGESDAGE